MAFKENLEFGEDGEKLVQHYLLQNGFVVLPLWQFSANSTPLLFYGSIALPSPDLMAWKCGVAYFFDSKRKSRFIEYKGRRETGCDDKAYSNYLKCASITGFKTILVFLHGDDPRDWYCGDVQQIEPYKRLWNGCKPTGERVSKPLALFNVDILKRFTNA